MLHLEPVAVLGDNYVWLLRPDDVTDAVVVDPGASGPVIDALTRTGSGVEAVLITHHHHDHVGGLDDLVARFDAPVFGPEGEHVAGVGHPVGDGDQVRLYDGAVVLEVMHVPGHTLGHVAYAGHGLALVGDTMFGGGCGRVFEGTAEQMHTSLSRLAALDGDTAVACAHEYTVSNLEFAVRVDPDNEALAERLVEARQRRREGLPTLPTTIAIERATNPFLRCDLPQVVDAATRHAGRTVRPGADAFAVIRSWKDCSG